MGSFTDDPKSGPLRVGLYVPGLNCARPVILRDEEAT